MATSDETISAAYEAHASMLRRRFLRATWDEATADDLVQDVFARLIAEVRSGRTPDNVGGWLYRVGMNLLASQARHEAVARRNAARLLPDEAAEPPGTQLECDDLARRLRTAITALGPDDRTAILLAARGTGGDELARLLGRSQSASRTLLCRARSRLRVNLETA